MRISLCQALLAALITTACAGEQRNAVTPDSPNGEVRATHDRAAHQHGVVDFPVSCNAEARQQLETGLAHLHHMMYEQAASHFSSAARADQTCAMAHWGIAMASFQPLWHPTPDEGLRQGRASIATAQRLGAPTAREQGYIAAAAAFFTDPQPPAETRPLDHELRLSSWMVAQRELHETYPEDVDAAAFYALAEVAYSMAQFSPDTERDYTRERRAGALLEQYLEQYPEHPGLFHYLIHAYDSSELAPKAEDIARRYDKLAPDVPHALHMPSHIFVRTGQWEETAEWNERSAESAKRQPVNGITSLHYPHALDYMMYAYLQLGEEGKAREVLERVQAIERAQDNLASAYGIAAPQARYHLERRRWQEAAELRPRYPDAVAWENFPTAEALFHYARGLGAARSGDLSRAEVERSRIMDLSANLQNAGDAYWGAMTGALGQAVQGWVLYEQGEKERALAVMKEAADLEDSMDKHPITPGEIFPVRELYGEMLLLEGQAEAAQGAFRAALERTPNRRNALAGLRRSTAAAEQARRKEAEDGAGSSAKPPGDRSQEKTPAPR